MAVGFSGKIILVEGGFKGYSPVAEDPLNGTTEADYYVDFELGSNSNDGSFASPFATLRHATETVSDNGSVSIVKKHYVLDAGTPFSTRAAWDGFGGQNKTYTVYGSGALVELTTNGNAWETVLTFIDGDNLAVTVDNMFFMTFGNGHRDFWENGTVGTAQYLLAYCQSNSSDMIFNNCKIWNDTRDYQNYLNCVSGTTTYTGGESYADNGTFTNQGSISYSGHTANYSGTGITVVSKPTASAFRTSVGY